jgi:hypothetical protein
LIRRREVEGKEISEHFLTFTYDVLSKIKKGGAK